MDTEKADQDQEKNTGQDEQKKPIIDQMTDLAAEAAGTLSQRNV